MRTEVISAIALATISLLTGQQVEYRQGGAFDGGEAKAGSETLRPPLGGQKDSSCHFHQVPERTMASEPLSIENDFTSGHLISRCLYPLLAILLAHFGVSDYSLRRVWYYP